MALCRTLFYPLEDNGHVTKQDKASTLHAHEDRLSCVRNKEQSTNKDASQNLAVCVCACIIYPNGPCPCRLLASSISTTTPGRSKVLCAPIATPRQYRGRTQTDHVFLPPKQGEQDQQSKPPKDTAVRPPVGQDAGCEGPIQICTADQAALAFRAKSRTRPQDLSDATHSRTHSARQDRNPRPRLPIHHAESVHINRSATR